MTAQVAAQQTRRMEQFVELAERVLGRKLVVRRIPPHGRPQFEHSAFALKAAMLAWRHGRGLCLEPLDFVRHFSSSQTYFSDQRRDPIWVT